MAPRLFICSLQAETHYLKSPLVPNSNLYTSDYFKNSVNNRTFSYVVSACFAYPQSLSQPLYPLIRQGLAGRQASSRGYQGSSQTSTPHKLLLFRLFPGSSLAFLPLGMVALPRSLRRPHAVRDFRSRNLEVPSIKVSVLPLLSVTLFLGQPHISKSLQRLITDSVETLQDAAN